MVLHILLKPINIQNLSFLGPVLKDQSEGREGHTGFLKRAAPKKRPSPKFTEAGGGGNQREGVVPLFKIVIESGRAIAPSDSKLDFAGIRFQGLIEFHGFLDIIHSFAINISYNIPSF